MATRPGQLSCPTMCLILFAHRIKPTLPLVLIANRDEFYSRPTRDAQFWSEEPATAAVLAGRDLTAGGTWIALAQDGRWAAVTNIRNPADSRAGNRSRGELPVNFLTGTLSPLEYLEGLQSRDGEDAGFNLLAGDGQVIAYLNSDSRQVRELAPGYYGLSNGRLDDPWPKVIRGKQGLKTLLQGDGPPGVDRLFDLVTDTTMAPDGELPVTGISLELERQLSASFIISSERDYGTRCSTALILGDGNQARFCEQNYARDGSLTSRHFFEFATGRL